MRSETKVGLLFIVAIVLTLGFAYFLGALNLFSSGNTIKLAYNFAGGVEVGSPVRVMGIKVGRVQAIDFKPHFKMKDGEEVNLLITVSINDKAWKTLKKDSRFFINLAGVIGEKFIEVTPGSQDSENLVSGVILRGEDPPRIDQLISQSYGLAGRVIEFVEENEGSVVDTVKMMNDLVGNLNSLLSRVDKMGKRKDFSKILKNSGILLEDLVYLTQKSRTKDGQKTIELLHKLLWRLEGVDGEKLKKFFQEEGIKAKIF